MSRYSLPVDILNRGLQHLGATRVLTPTDNSKNAAEATFVYDKCRRAELRANPWNFSARRLVLRPFVPGLTQFFTVPNFSLGSTYTQGSLTFSNSTNWVNNLPSIIGILPGEGSSPQVGWSEFLAPQFFNPYVAGTTYYAGELVGFSGILYITPTMTTATPPGAPWLSLSGATLSSVPFYSPQGLTTNALTTPKPAYPLPFGYLRVMPQDPKSVSTPAQLTTAGTQNLDFEFEAGFLLSNLTKGGPIVFRFSGDLTNVLWFDDLFCEVLACRIALELAETLTQSPAKMQAVQTLYNGAIEKAIRVNAIEAGSTEPDTNEVASQRGPTREKLPPQPQPRQQQQ